MRITFFGISQREQNAKKFPVKAPFLHFGVTATTHYSLERSSLREKSKGSKREREGKQKIYLRVRVSEQNT